MPKKIVEIYKMRFICKWGLNNFIICLLILVFCNPIFSQENFSGLEQSTWYFSKVDFNTFVKDSILNKKPHILSIIRESSAEDKKLIRLAESLYPDKLVAIKNYNPEKTSNKTSKLNAETKSYWSQDQFDGVKVASFVSTKAIKYYQQLSLAFINKRIPKDISPMESTSFFYKANAQSHQNFVINNQHFDNVKVVKMELSWYQYCGMLCAMGISTTKVVIFKDNKPIALFFDNGGEYWVS